MLSSLKRGRTFYTSLFALAGPLILQNFISSSAGLIDTFMVGSLGQDELASLSLANTPFFIIMLLVFGLQSGGSVLMSQYWGKRDKSAINRVVGVSWMFALSLSLMFALAMFFFPRSIMSLTSNNPVLVDVAVRYGKIVAFSCVMNAFVVIYFGARRACESPLFGTIVVSVGMVSNVILNYILIFGKLGLPAMGIEGAAWATFISRVIELAVTILYIVFGDRKHKVVLLKLKLILRPGMLITRDFLKYSAPVMLNETLWAFGFSLYTVIYGHMPNSSDVVAAYTLAGTVERIVTVIMFAVANSAAVFIGKAIGAGDSTEEVYSLGKTFAWLAFLAGLISGLLLLAALFVVVKPYIFGIFKLTIAAQGICVFMTLVMGTIMSFRSFITSLIVGILRGGGDVKFGLYLDIGAMFLWSLPAAALAALVFNLDIMWVYLLVISEEPIKATIGFLRFRSRKWIKNVTRDFAVGDA